MNSGKMLAWICMGLVFIMIGNMTFFQFCSAVLKSLGVGGSTFLQEAAQYQESPDQSLPRTIPTQARRRQPTNLGSSSGNSEEDFRTVDELPDLEQQKQQNN